MLAIRPFAGLPEVSGDPLPRRPDFGWWWTHLDRVPGMRPAQAERAADFGLVTVGDLLLHVPFRYERYGGATPISASAVGQDVTVRVTVHSVRLVPTRRRGLVTVRALVSDDTGRLEAVWFNQRHLLRTLSPGDTVLIRGTIGPGTPRAITVRAHEILGGDGSEGLHTTGMVPVYAATEALPSARIRELVDQVRGLAAAAPEVLPAWIRSRVGLMTRADALLSMHFPRTAAAVRQGRRRLVIEELIELQLGLMLLRRQEAQTRPAPRLAGTGELSAVVREGLPFALTDYQERTLGQISRDLRRTTPMRRLLQGDVGSGKTLVAALAMCQVLESGAQAALMVPTETLAEQHLQTLDALLVPAGVTPVLVTGKVPSAERERRLMAIRTGTASVVVGTQALLSEGVAFHNLGLVVVDEQHRFGVDQRHALTERARDATGQASHLLYMTATPIPRTLALTAYGELAVSTIRGRPAGRGPVETRWIRDTDRDQAYAEIRGEVRQGYQAYVICPLVDEGGSAEAKAATAEARRLSDGPFSECSVGLVHGAMKPDVKRAAMAAFVSGETDVLVATTVIEVGIDVPNATIILIEGADRFGLAQLHQLRGRVGRGDRPGQCIVFGEPTTDDGIRRLEAFTQTGDGFRLAELDLEIRGEGSMLGVRQAGPTDLRFARLTRDRRELAQARQLARRLLRADPNLQAPEHRLLRSTVSERFSAIPRLLEA
jgi:ATP-dependent DNA helicase RecG